MKVKESRDLPAMYPYPVHGVNRDEKGRDRKIVSREKANDEKVWSGR